MDFLPGSFIIFRIVGLWRTSHNNIFIYRLRTVLTLFLLYTFVGCSIIGIAMKHDDMERVASDCFLMISVLGCCGKSVNVLICRNKILNMIDILQNDPCLPRDDIETDIQKKFDTFIWKSTIIYGILTEITAGMLTFGTLLLDLPEGELPFNTWLPYDHSHGFIYKFAYGQQIISVMTSANIAIAFGTLVPALILQVCAKLNILKHRFTNITNYIYKQQLNNNDLSFEEKLNREKELIADFVRCHLTIIKLAETINSTFNLMIFLQCLISATVLCTSVYKLVTVPLFSSEFSSIVLYLACMLSEIYMLCAAGNEVILVSGSISDAIYCADWTKLNISTIKSLVLIMNRAMHPVTFTSGYIVILSYDTFKSLLKISYSTYNVLQQKG